MARTAQGAFIAHREAIRCQLKTLDQLMNVEDYISPEQIHWGHVGSLAHVEEILQQAINFLLQESDPVDSEPDDFYDEHDHNYQAEVGRGLRLHQRR